MSRVDIGMQQGGETSGVIKGGASSYDSRHSLRDSAIVAVGSTVLTLILATLAAYCLSRMTFGGQQTYLFWVLSQRFMPPIAMIIPVVFMFRDLGLRDTYTGLILVHTLINLPLAVLLLKSFFDDVPREVDEAAMIDGATRFQTFRRVVLPMVRGGIAATAVLCFIFSWTEFLLSLVPHHVDPHRAGQDHRPSSPRRRSEWGFITALGHIGHHSELHLHPARPETSGARPDPRFAEGLSAA